MRHFLNFQDIMKNTEAPLMRYPKMFFIGYISAMIPAYALCEMLPSFSSLGKHKGLMATDFHNPKLFWDNFR